MCTLAKPGSDDIHSQNNIMIFSYRANNINHVVGHRLIDIRFIPRLTLDSIVSQNLRPHPIIAHHPVSAPAHGTHQDTYGPPRPAPSTVHAPRARLQHITAATRHRCCVLTRPSSSTTLVDFTPGLHMCCMYGLQRAVVSRAGELRSTCYSWHPVPYITSASNHLEKPRVLLFGGCDHTH